MLARGSRCRKRLAVAVLLLGMYSPGLRQASPQAYYPGPGLRFIPLPARVAHDSASLINGDKVTGTVEAVTDGKVVFNLDAVGQAAEFPTSNFVEISFAGPPGGREDSATGVRSDQKRARASPPNEGRGDAIYLRDGSRLSATIKRLMPDGFEVAIADGHRRLSSSDSQPLARNPEDQASTVSARNAAPGSEQGLSAQAATAEGADASSPPELSSAPESEQTIVIPKSEVLGIGFYRPSDILFQSDFSSREKMGFVPVVGSWAIEKNQLVQASPLPFCRAHVPVVQAGVMRYEWAADISSPTICGLAFFVERMDTRFGDSAYMAMVRGPLLHFYKIIGEARHEGRRDAINLPGPLVRFKIEYDPRSGEIVVWAEDNVLMRLLDPDPLQAGKYVVLHTEGRASFDDVKVTHLVGGMQGLTPAADFDTVVLSTSDRVSGQVVGISEKVVLKNSYTPVETAIDRGSIRCIVFASPATQTKATKTDLPRISLWNGDVIFGDIVAADANDAVLKPLFGPELTLPRTSLRTITFPRVRPSSSHATGKPTASLHSSVAAYLCLKTPQGAFLTSVSGPSQTNGSRAPDMTRAHSTLRKIFGGPRSKVALGVSTTPI